MWRCPRTECQTVPEPVFWNGVVRRWRYDAALWNRGANQGSWGFQGRTATSRAEHSRIRWRSWGSIAVGGKRYKDLKAAQSPVDTSTVHRHGVRIGKEGGGLSATPSGPQPAVPPSRESPRTPAGVASTPYWVVLHGWGRPQRRWDLRAVGNLSTWKDRFRAWIAEGEDPLLS